MEDRAKRGINLTTDVLRKEDHTESSVFSTTNQGISEPSNP